MDDITQEFLSHCSALDAGELIHVDDFQLSQAMTAIEAMDEKMDCGIVRQRPVLDVTTAMETGLLPLKDLSCVDLLGCMDETLAAMVNWLEGDMLAQTIYTNMYMHCISRIEHKSLRAFCEAVSKVVNLTMSMYECLGVYREEDFSNVTQGLPLDRADVSESQVMELLKKADDELSKKAKSSSNEPWPAVVTRIRFIEFFLGFLISTKRYLDHEKEYGPSQVKQDVHKFLDLLQKVVPNLIESSPLGQPALGKENPNAVPYGVVGFEPFLNVSLLPPAVNKTTKIMDRKAAFLYFEGLFKRLRFVLKVWSLDSRCQLARQVNFLQTYGRSGLNGHTCLLSRTLLYLAFYHPSSVQVLGSPHVLKREIYSSLLHQFYQYAEPWPLIDSLLQPGGECDLAASRVSMFVERMSSHIGHLQHMYSYNRSRQHDLLSNYIHSSWLHYDDSLKIDHYVRKALKDEGHLEEKQLPTVHFHSAYVLYLLYHLMWDYVQAGFDLNLYAPYELPGLYYCVFEMLFFPFENHLKDIHGFLRSHPTKSNSSANGAAPSATAASGKKSRRGGGSANDTASKKTPSLSAIVGHLSTEDVGLLHERVRVYFLFSKATLCALGAFDIDGKFSRPELEFGSYEMLFLNRLSPLLNTGMYEPRDVFVRAEAFWSQLHNNPPTSCCGEDHEHGADHHHPHPPQTEDAPLIYALDTALKCYEMARNCLTESMAKSQPLSSANAVPDAMQVTSPFPEEERQQLLLVAKVNSVVCTLLKSGHKRGASAKLDLEWRVENSSRTLFFPRFRLSS